MLLIALMSLSAVAGLIGDFMILSAVNCSSFGIIIFLPVEAIFKPLSSTNPAMSINDCSSEVSLRSAATVRTFEKVPPVASG